MELRNHDHDHKLTFISEESNKNLRQIAPTANLIYSVYKSMCVKSGITYYSDRVEIDGQNCLVQTIQLGTGPAADAPIVAVQGMGNQPEDPRLFVYHDRIYEMINIVNPCNGDYRLMAITPYDDFKPVVLRIKGFPINLVEKNWTPLIKDDQLYLIYMFDPMVVVRYNFNPEGVCELIYKQEGTVFPITGNCYLRGGSQLLPLGKGRYFGLCHSRVLSGHTNVGGYPYPYYLPHMIVIDTNQWKVIYLSKPLRFEVDNASIVNHGGTPIKTVAGTNVIFDEGDWMTTLTPNSLCPDTDGSYLVMGTVNDSRCLKFRLRSLPMSFDEVKHEIGYWNNRAKNTTIDVVRSCTAHPSTYY